MNGQFFDTNVIVYAHDPGDPRKQGQARASMHEAMVSRAFVISTQVMQEFHSVALRRQWMRAGQAADVLRLLAGYRVVPADAASVLRAFALQQRHRLSVWDALIVQAAIDARCGVRYSEDLQAGLRFDAPASPVGALRVVNPFDAGAEPAVHGPKGRYRVAVASASAGPRRSRGR
jgi:predicted nucleic acid-binding protein